MTTIETGFKYLEFDKNTEFEEDTTSKNYLLFFLKGDFTITCNQFHNRLFHAGEMILIPRSSRLKGIAETGSNLLSMFFDMPEGNCDKLILQSLSDLCDMHSTAFLSYSSLYLSVPCTQPSAPDLPFPAALICPAL